MEFTKSQKEIIKNIANGTIIDLFTYVTKYLKYEEFKYDVESIKRTKKDYCEKINIYMESNNKIIPSFCLPNNIAMPPLVNLDHLSEEMEFKEKGDKDYRINEKDFDYKIIISNNEYEINLLSETFYFVDDLYNKILEFLLVWQKLQAQQLILVIPKEFEIKDTCILFKKRHNLLVEPSKINTLMFSTLLPIDIPSDKEYVDEIIEIDDKTMVIAENFIAKKMIPTLELSKLVQDDFVSEEEKKYKFQVKTTKAALCITFIATIISFVLGATSLWISISSSLQADISSKNSAKQYSELFKLLKDIDNNLMK